MEVVVRWKNKNWVTFPETGEGSQDIFGETFNIFIKYLKVTRNMDYTIVLDA